MRAGLILRVASVATAAIVAWAGLAHGQDASKGKVVFEQCSVCHTTDGTPKTGPSLKGVVGRPSGTFPGFRYSRAMKNSHLTWDAGNLNEYIANPQEKVPGNVMPFSGIADTTQRADLIAYLSTLK
jgi:cytochrome c